MTVFVGPVMIASPISIAKKNRNTNQEEEFQDEWREKSILEDYWKAEQSLGILFGRFRGRFSGNRQGSMAMIQGIASSISGFGRREWAFSVPLGVLRERNMAMEKSIDYRL